MLDVAVHVDVKVTLACDKLGLASHQAARALARSRSSDIGIPARLAAKDGVIAFIAERTDAEARCRADRLGDQKGTHDPRRRHAGSVGKVGAALLATGGACAPAPGR